MKTNNHLELYLKKVITDLFLDLDQDHGISPSENVFLYSKLPLMLGDLEAHANKLIEEWLNYSRE